MFKVVGKIITISKPEVLTPTLSKVCVVVLTEERYPQEQQFELFNEKISMVNGLKPEDRVDITFNIRTTKVVDGNSKMEKRFRFFNSLRSVTITKLPEPSIFGDEAVTPVVVEEENSAVKIEEEKTQA